MISRIGKQSHKDFVPARSPFADDAGRWQALVERDRNADDEFWYSVRTTGVYCRPSCAARLAKRENVCFHDSCEQAEQAGFRPCKRCRPKDAPLATRQNDLVARACRLIAESETNPTLTQLSDSVGLSRHHFHRMFKTATGVTPKGYANAHRTGRVRDRLTKRASVTQAIQAAGYQSNAQFYATATERLGMTPTEFRAAGKHVDIRFAVGECSLGSILVAATAKGICAILLGDDPDALARDLQARFSQATFRAGDATFERWVAGAVALVEQPALGINLPLDIRGTAFQIRVWNALRRIPTGSTVTYTDIATQIGRPTAARAVAQACAANAIAVAIPCHRVVRTDASLAGYRWGVERKAELLKRERAKP